MNTLAIGPEPDKKWICQHDKIWYCRNLMKRTLRIIIATTLKDWSGEADALLEDPEKDIVLFGSSGILDSMALVNFIADLEYNLSQELGYKVIIADDRAMSKYKSPFGKVSNLELYLADLLKLTNGPAKTDK